MRIEKEDKKYDGKSGQKKIFRDRERRNHKADTRREVENFLTGNYNDSEDKE